MNHLDQDLRTMLRQRADGVAAAPVVPDSTVLRARVRKALWTGGALAVVAAVAVMSAVVLRSTVWTDAAPVPPAERKEREQRETPLPGPQLDQIEVATGHYEGAPWRLMAGPNPEMNGEFCLSGLFRDARFGPCVPPNNEPVFAGKEAFPDVAIISGAVTPDIVRVVFSEGGQTLSTETIAAPPELGEDLRFFVLFAPFATDVSCTDWTDVETVNCFGRKQKVVGFDASGEVVDEDLVHPLEIWDFQDGRTEQRPDEFVADGSVGGLRWRLTAGSDHCFDFSLGSQTAGGSACLPNPGQGWFGEVGQRVEPQRPDVAPVYGAIPSHVDEAEVVLDDGTEIRARIFRPEDHPIAYYLAWIPDAFASGSVRFIAGGNELGSRPLCAVDYLGKADGFICYGSPETQ